MSKHKITVPEAAIIIVAICVLVLGLLYATAVEGVLRYTGLTIVSVGILLVLMICSDLFDAWSNERYVEEHPETLRNSEVGQKAVVVEAFSKKGSISEGRVLMTGETWAGRSNQGHLLENQETVTVVGREGLVLLVEREQEAEAIA